MASLGVVIGQNSDLNFGGGARKDNGCDRRAQFTPSVVKEHIAPILHIKYPQTAKAYNTPSRGISLLPNLPVSKKLPEEQIFCGADPLGSQALCHVLLVSSPFFIYLLLLYFFHHFGATVTYKCPSPGTNPLSPLSFQVPIPE